ncbi:hypothetical protein [Leptospira brenneri]|uniref:Lipoprotein n=1 Tax=Leptospira brenneri TaxID=2023182 RepID=A0A2M9XZV1_9LEPT|nr:hypothetical protein [Leptospira brenneri]PJZ44848.1 hypothetical protein CH361_14525 [Leptospira brenneri]TGK97094.1 hypothetical protein EHQ30_11045 [Leptospira brenneri]
MKNRKPFIKTILLFVFLLFQMIVTTLSCRESNQKSGWVPLSLISIAKEIEDQEKLNQCMGRVPGQICITVVEEHPANIRQINLLQAGIQISTLDVTGFPITDAMCYVYYNIEWGNGTPYRSTKIYLKNTSGEICGIGWEKHSGETKDQLLNLQGTEKQLNTVTEIESNGMTLKFYR